MPGMGRWWRSSARPVWGSRASCTRWSIRTAPRAGRGSKARRRSPMARPRRTPVLDLLKRYAQVEDRDDTRTIRARVTRQVLTLDAALQGDAPSPAGAAGCPAGGQPVRTLDPPQRRRRTLDALKRVLLRESPGATPAPGLRGSALDRYRDPGPARRLGPEPAHGGCCCWSTIAPVPARLGQQDVLHATAAGPTAAGERRRTPTPSWGTTPAWSRSSNF